MELKRKNLCPLLKKECIGLDCVWFVKLYGTDPQDKDKLIEEWDCAIVWQVKGLLETAKRTGGGLLGVQQATESLRNEMVELNEASLAMSGNPDAIKILEMRRSRQDTAIRAIASAPASTNDTAPPIGDAPSPA